MKQDKSIIYVKLVKPSKLTELFEIRTIAIYAGYKFEVVDEKDDMISIVTMGGDYRVWLDLGMKCIDKGVYQKWIHKDEAEIIIEKEQR